MDIIFRRTKDKEIANNHSLLQRKFRGNNRRCDLVRSRLDDLEAAETLDVMRNIPQAYCHELKGNRKGQLSVKLDKGYVMLFEPANQPVPLKEDGGLDWAQVTAIQIIELAENYHD